MIIEFSVYKKIIFKSMGEEVNEKKVKERYPREKTEKFKKGRKGSMRSIKEEVVDQDDRNDCEKNSDVQEADLEELNKPVETWTSLVENIENWTLDQSNKELLEVVKKQLKFEKIDLNNLKLVKNKRGDKDIAPIHAAVSSNSPELIQMVLETEGINPDPEYLCMGQLSGGILDYAVTCNVKIEIIRMIMENIKISVDLVNAYEEALPRSLVTAVKLDRLDIVKLLLKQQSKYPEFNSFSFLIVAIEDDNSRIFSKVLRKVGDKIDDTSGVCEDTMLHKCVKLNRVKMLRELVKAGCDVNVKNLDGLSPLALAVFNAGFGCCGDGCVEKIISALLRAESCDLNVSVQEGGLKSRAIDYLNEKTCQHVRKLIEQAYSGNKVPFETKENIASKSDTEKSSKPDDNKICWSCSADPTQLTLWRCRGCLVAWYCGEKCQEEDWPVHGPWCERRSCRREEKHKAKKEECRMEVKETSCDVD